MLSKRSFALTLVVVLVISSLGVLTASAASAPAERTTQTQSEPDSAKPWLGVLVSDTENGAKIEDVVADSPAEDAGLTIGDVITAVDETAIDSAAALVEAVQTYVVGDEITLTVLADDEETSVSVTLAERPASTHFEIPDMQTRPYAMQGRMNMLGIDMEMTGDGLLINTIDEDSPLADSGLQEGDLITAIDGEPIVDFMPRGLLAALNPDEPVMLAIVRDGEEIEVEFDVTGMIEEVIPFTPGDMDSMTITTRPTQLGVYYQTITAELAADEGLDVENGALITEVIEDTPAAEAGLQAGDIVLAVDGDVVDEERTLPDRLYAYEEGDVVTLTVLRDGEEIALEVTLGPRATTMYGHGMPMFGEDFLENHPFMHDFFGQMPGDGFHFYFGPDGSTPNESDSGLTDENNTNA